MAQALEGKDVKDLLLNVGSGGGAAAAAAPAAGGAGGAAAPEAAEEKKEEKEEGMSPSWLLSQACDPDAADTMPYREGGVRRGHGFRSVRLSLRLCLLLSYRATTGVSVLKRVSCRLRPFSRILVQFRSRWSPVPLACRRECIRPVVV